MVTRRITRLEPHDEKRERLTENGITFLGGEIDEDTSYVFTVDMMDAALSGVFANKPLLVVLNSPGGRVDQGLAIYDCITTLVESGIIVNILGLGEVASMGTVIMQAATKRLSAPNTQFLVHQISQSISFFGEKTEELNETRERLQELDRLNDIVMGIIAKRCNIDPNELKKLCAKKDYWMDATGARQLGTNGLIDEVTTVPLSEILRKK